jgi:hypothetical protein
VYSEIRKLDENGESIGILQKALNSQKVFANCRPNVFQFNDLAYSIHGKGLNVFKKLISSFARGIRILIYQNHFPSGSEILH